MSNVSSRERECRSRMSSGFPTGLIWEWQKKATCCALNETLQCAFEGGDHRMPWDFGLDPNSVAYKIAAATAKACALLQDRHGQVIRDEEASGASIGIRSRAKEDIGSTFTRVAAEDLHRELQKLDATGCEELEGVTLHSSRYASCHVSMHWRRSAECHAPSTSLSCGRWSVTYVASMGVRS